MNIFFELVLIVDEKKTLEHLIGLKYSDWLKSCIEPCICHNLLAKTTLIPWTSDFKMAPKHQCSEFGDFLSVPFVAFF